MDEFEAKLKSQNAELADLLTKTRDETKVINKNKTLILLILNK